MDEITNIGGYSLCVFPLLTHTFHHLTGCHLQNPLSKEQLFVWSFWEGNSRACNQTGGPSEREVCGDGTGLQVHNPRLAVTQFHLGQQNEAKRSGRNSLLFDSLGWGINHPLSCKNPNQETNWQIKKKDNHWPTFIKMDLDRRPAGCAHRGLILLSVLLVFYTHGLYFLADNNSIRMRVSCLSFLRT